MKQSLVVTDNPEVRQKLSEALHSLGFTVFVAESVKESLNILVSKSNISLVVTDRVFGQKEGEWLIHSMQKDDKLKKIPVIVMGEYSGIRNIYNLLKIGAAAFIPTQLFDRYFKDYVSRFSSR